MGALPFSVLAGDDLEVLGLVVPPDGPAVAGFLVQAVDHAAVLADGGVSA